MAENWLADAALIKALTAGILTWTTALPEVRPTVHRRDLPAHLLEREGWLD